MQQLLLNINSVVVRAANIVGNETYRITRRIHRIKIFSKITFHPLSKMLQSNIGEIEVMKPRTFNLYWSGK